MKKRWTTPEMSTQQIDMDKLGDVSQLSDVELKNKLEEAGYKFQNTQRIYYSNPNYVLREIAGEAVLVSIGEGIADFSGIITLNLSAKILWETIKKGATKEKLVENLKNYFQISDEQATEDVEKSLKLLEEKGLVSCE